MNAFVSPETFDCAACGASGPGGKPALDVHVATAHPSTPADEVHFAPPSLRTWARRNGHPDLEDHGRIPLGVREAYELAMTQEGPE
ncbi:MAG: hypothetical protein Q7V58_09600 [Actinomycetota bacterium]|nr:hypothetical protein [Actinomycetota bacterium]